ncbi:hypothetical protein [Metabacillus arenae]|uniref:Uncharacterized protein n=1 Tax=Metabacillus arenae TaxID=2771434 RepID=A0A926NIB9_9BACI|nr:hypothetical protein [Metabacillus arenae]MBD1382224.1 hypothetical protein [Metabacillus arenae]
MKKTAKNNEAGYAIGVLSGVGSEEELQKLADFVIPNVEYLINKNHQFIWEKALSKVIVTINKADPFEK